MGMNMRKIISAIFLIVAIASAAAVQGATTVSGRPAPGGAAACANNIAYTAGSDVTGQSSFGGTSKTITKTVTAGDFVIVAVNGSAALGTVTVTDDADTPNTYTGLTKRAYLTTNSVQVFYSHIATSKTNATITISAASNSGYMRINAGTFTGVATSSFTDIDTGATGNADAISVSSGDLAVCSELVIADVSTGATTVTDTSGMDTMAAYSVSNFVKYKIVTATSAVTYSSTLDSVKNYAVSVVTFKSN